MIRIIDGNLLESGADIICHQVNCQGKMNSGVAKQIREKYPNVYEQYKKAFTQVSNSSSLLGHAQGVLVDGNKRIIFNLFAQNNYGYDGKQYTDVQALENCFEDLVSQVKKLEVLHKCTFRIAIPYKIGCVRGGAKWDEVYSIIEEVFKDIDVELWRLDKG